MFVNLQRKLWRGMGIGKVMNLTQALYPCLNLLLCALHSPKVMFPAYNYVRTINSCDYLATSNSQREVDSTTTLSLVKPPSFLRNIIKKFLHKINLNLFFFFYLPDIITSSFVPTHAVGSVQTRLRPIHTYHAAPKPCR